MSTIVKLALGLVALVIAAAAGGLLVVAVNDDAATVPAVESAGPAPAEQRDAGPAPPPADADDRPLSDAEADRAVAAALQHIGGGTISELDRSDDPGEAYELEVVKDGREIDLALDGEFRRVPNRRYDD
jgi:hypothetical protein